jgi:DNA-directed RNA polymerase subunit RPC12/RpoP
MASDTHITPLVCPVCRSGRVDKGRLMSAGETHMRLDDAKFFTLKTGNIEVDAYICADCGSIYLFGDAEKVRALRKP